MILNDKRSAALVANIVASPKMLSTRWMAICASLGAAWFLIPEADRDAFIKSLPIPAVWLPILAGLIGYVFRVWPQFQPDGAPLVPPVVPVDPVPPEGLTPPVEAAVADMPTTRSRDSHGRFMVRTAAKPEDPLRRLERAADEKWLKALRMLKASDENIARLTSVVALQRDKERA